MRWLPAVGYLQLTIEPAKEVLRSIVFWILNLLLEFIAGDQCRP